MTQFNSSVWRHGSDLKELRHNSLPWFAAGLVFLLSCYGILQQTLAAPSLVLSLLLYAGLVAGVWLGLPAHLPHKRFGAANGITLLRAVLACLLGGLVARMEPAQLGWLPFAAALVIMGLDGLDGWIARRTGCASTFGARFDMETDSLLVLLLCASALVMDKAGPWILLAGGLRYLFLAGKGVLPWMKGTLPDCFRRKALYVISTSGVILALAPVVTASFSHVISAVAVAGLVISFLIDISWLHRNTHMERKSK